MTGGAADGRLGDGQIDRPAGALGEVGGEHASAKNRAADSLCEDLGAGGETDRVRPDHPCAVGLDVAASYGGDAEHGCRERNLGRNCRIPRRAYVVAPAMCTTSGTGKPANRWSAGMSAGPPASWISRSVPAVSGIALSAISATGRPAPLRGAHRVTGCATHVVAGTSTVSACLRWPRHSATPRPINATPVGTANGRLKDSGSTDSARAEVVP